jgi:hypothetical protein
MRNKGPPAPLAVLSFLLPLLAVAGSCAAAFVASPPPLSARGNPVARRREPIGVATMAASCKILFLHGKGESGPAFQQRLGPLEAALKARNPGVVCWFATAPHEIADGKWAWWYVRVAWACLGIVVCGAAEEEQEEQEVRVHAVVTHARIPDAWVRA